MKLSYRGQTVQFSYPRHILIAQPTLNLTYRGVAYRTTETGAIESVASIETRPALEGIHADAGQPVPVRQSRRAMIAEVAKVHHENIQRSLQHRLEVAKARGDDNLIHQLEQEMQQFV
jgi:Domain of unknown function (DUF4278)